METTLQFVERHTRTLVAVNAQRKAAELTGYAGPIGVRAEPDSTFTVYLATMRGNVADESKAHAVRTLENGDRTHIEAVLRGMFLVSAGL